MGTSREANGESSTAGNHMHACPPADGPDSARKTAGFPSRPAASLHGIGDECIYGILQNLRRPRALSSPCHLIFTPRRCAGLPSDCAKRHQAMMCTYLRAMLCSFYRAVRPRCSIFWWVSRGSGRGALLSWMWVYSVAFRFCDDPFHLLRVERPLIQLVVCPKSSSERAWACVEDESEKDLSQTRRPSFMTFEYLPYARTQNFLFCLHPNPNVTES